MTKSILIVCPHAPPSTAAAAARIGGLLHHLPRLGFRPMLITAVPGEDPPDGRRVCVPDIDLALLATRVRRWTRSPQQARSEAHADVTGRTDSRIRAAAYSLATFPDRHWPWALRVVAAARLVAQGSEKPVAVLTSSPPEAAHLAGWAIATRFGIPWSADLRDLWSQNPYSRQVALRTRIDAVVERAVLGKAQSLITISEPLADRLAEIHGRRPYVVPNGVDLEAYELNRVDEKEAGATGPLTLVHTGALYGGRRDPAPLFAAIARLLASGTLDPTGIRVDFVGRDSEVALEIAGRHGVRGVVRALPVEPKADALERQRSADVLLLLLRDDRSERGTQPAKAFEYLAARRPILAIGFAGGVADGLLQQTRAGDLFSSRAEDELTAWLRSIVERRRSTGRRPPFLGEPDQIRQWGQERMARSMLAAMGLKPEE